MLLRRVVAILAFVGVLVHSTAIVRHHALMTTQASDAAFVAMLSELGAICHAPALDQWPDAASGGGTSTPMGGSQSCPICSGLASVFLLAPPVVPVLALSLPLGLAYDLKPDQRLTQLKRIRPQGRGPPSLA